MEELQLAAILEEDFKTVKLVFESDASTCGLDAFILAWTKHEKQLRKLFSFLVYRQEFVTDANRTQFKQAIADNKKLDYRSLSRLIEKLGAKPPYKDPASFKAWLDETIRDQKIGQQHN